MPPVELLIVDEGKLASSYKEEGHPRPGATWPSIYIPLRDPSPSNQVSFRQELDELSSSGKDGRLCFEFPVRSGPDEQAIEDQAIMDFANLVFSSILSSNTTDGLKERILYLDLNFDIGGGSFCIDQRMTTRILNSLANFIRQLPNLESLSISGDVPLQTQRKILDAASNTTLKELYWNIIAITVRTRGDTIHLGNEMNQFAFSLSQKKELVSMTLSGQHPNEAFIVPTILQVLSNLPKFKILSFLNFNLGLQTLLHCQECLSDMIETNKLVSLDLRAPPIGYYHTTSTTSTILTSIWSNLSSSIQNSTILKNLSLKGFSPLEHANDFILLPIVRNNKSIKRLELSGLIYLSYFRAQKIPKEVLEKFTDRLMKALGEYNSSITHIHLGYPTIGFNAVKKKFIPFLGGDCSDSDDDDTTTTTTTIIANHTIVDFGFTEHRLQDPNPFSNEESNHLPLYQVEFLLCYNRLTRKNWHHECDNNNNNSNSSSNGGNNPTDIAAMTTFFDTVQIIEVLEEHIPNKILDKKTSSSDAFKISLIYHMLRSIPDVVLMLLEAVKVPSSPQNNGTTTTSSNGILCNNNNSDSNDDGNTSSNVGAVSSIEDAALTTTSSACGKRKYREEDDDDEEMDY